MDVGVAISGADLVVFNTPNKTSLSSSFKSEDADVQHLVPTLFFTLRLLAHCSRDFHKNHNSDVLGLFLTKSQPTCIHLSLCSTWLCLQLSQLKVKEFDRGDGTYSFQYYFMKPARLLKVTITSQPTSAGVLQVTFQHLLACVQP